MKNADEVYLLSPTLLDEVFKDNLGKRENNLLEEIHAKFPFVSADAIKQFLSKARQDQIFSVI